MNIKTSITIIILYYELDPEKICMQYTFFMSIFFTTIEVLEKAMKEGHVSLTNIKMVICGPPAVGKTAFTNLLLGKTASKEYKSTPIARPVQAIQITTNTGDNDGKWKEAKEDDDLCCMLSDAIKKADTTPSHEEESSTTSDTPSPAYEAASSQEDTTSIQPLPEGTTAPVVSLPTAQASNDTTTSTLHPQPTSEATTRSEFKNLLETLHKQLANVKKNKALQQQELLKVKMIHLLDSGGQSQFTDLLPMFVRDDSLYIIVMKATESLYNKPAFFYSIDDKPVRAPNDLTMTNLEIIENSVRSIVAAAPSKPMFVILATHTDRLPPISLEVGLKKYNKKILERLDKFRDRFIFYKYKSNELIFPVNNLCENKVRQDKSAEIRDRLMPQSNEMNWSHKEEKPIPIRWYVFNILMKKKAEETHEMISFESCKFIGNECGMTSETMVKCGKDEFNVRECLKYLDSMRLCIYYHEVLPNVVFTNPQFLIDCITKIVQVSFDDDLQKKLPKGAYESLINGVFKKSLLKDLELVLNHKLFDESNLLTLLQHLNVISQIDDDQYFMPVLLPIERLTKEQKDYLKEKNDLLHITFKDKIFPKVSFIFCCQFISLLLFKGFISNNSCVSIMPRIQQ